MYKLMDDNNVSGLTLKTVRSSSKATCSRELWNNGNIDITEF